MPAYAERDAATIFFGLNNLPLGSHAKLGIPQAAENRGSPVAMSDFLLMPPAFCEHWEGLEPTDSMCCINQSIDNSSKTDVMCKVLI